MKPFMKPEISIAPLMAAICVAAILSGCGGGGSGSTRSDDAMMPPTEMQPEEETTGTGTHSPYDYGTWSLSAQDAAAFGREPNTVFGLVNTTMGLGVGYNSDGSWWIATSNTGGQPKVSGVWLGNWNGRYGDGVMDSGRAAVRVQIADDVQPGFDTT